MKNSVWCSCFMWFWKGKSKYVLFKLRFCQELIVALSLLDVVFEALAEKRHQKRCFGWAAVFVNILSSVLRKDLTLK